MATGIDENTGQIIKGVAELKQRLQRCMRTRKVTVPLNRAYGSNLPYRIDRNITPELEMDIYADVADMIAYPPNEFSDEIKLNKVWLERGENKVMIGLEVTLLFDGSVEKITGLSV
ncbi:dTDP-glucose pyrophosphorylase [Photobacterium sp. OFAV2-7]|uniref:dTDP-glucose pyrophosphorylase n=1 Tax=Photobacterium sp. OFAV2-7 TaxID=2917748 RepID=UPI001EF5CC81|nr:dTDP-glucose pyrophosphorylase [Photobacterium sp. OFAV2-7]MCG7585444.1 dTDP-glucose pyrophosphorylase [Photobacterium sp. OFAV2-7]